MESNPRGSGPQRFPGWWYTYPSEKYESQIGIIIPNIWLVVLTILKNMKVNGKDDNPYIMENHKIPWFQTTNQYIVVNSPLISNSL